MASPGGRVLMEAMIFAAGEGRRLRPLTERTPKALIDIGGEPLLAIVARRLAAAGAQRLVVNAHHRADRVVRFASSDAMPRIPVTVSREDEVSEAPLDTGGGLLLAAPLFAADEPIVLHNADILTDLDLTALYEAHVAGERADRRLATLVVARRDTTRPLFVDDEGVYGRANRAEGWEVIARHPLGGAREAGFAGIQVISPRMLGRITERGTFSIIETYLRLVGEGERIAVFEGTGCQWHDIGTKDRLAAAREAWTANAP